VLIDVHAHFLHDRSPRSDWRERNSSRLRAGERVGITVHVASILGSWGATSPIYFPSPADLEYGNNFLLALQHADPTRIRGYVTVNPNFQTHALREMERCLDAGMIGVKLAASRRADDPLLDPICRIAAQRGVPVLHHIWQGRRGDYPGQEASDAVELCALAGRHSNVGVERLVWGCDLTIDTGWAKLRYLEHLLSPAELELVRWRTAARLFPARAFPGD
jgi:predicted TIM-barrel fold metal-dependent hydrolase